MLGRRKRVDVWTHFNYIDAEKKSECLVLTDGKACGKKIAGKNTTNLKRHINLSHPNIKIPDVIHPASAAKETPSVASACFSNSKYNADSKEQRVREEAIAKCIARTGLPLRTVEDEDFIAMLQLLDKKLTVPKKTKTSNLVEQMYQAEKLKFKERLAMARRVSIGVDIWSKKGLTASFLAVSACFFNVQDNKAEHILLNLKQMTHPHTALSIAAHVDECLEEWAIPKEKVLTVITDNGSNMVSAFRHDDDTSSDDSGQALYTDDEEDEVEERYETLERTPCVVHTLQLVVKMIRKEPRIRRLLEKTSHLVNKFRKSSVANEQLLQRTELVLKKDCPTRWSSTFEMVSRLLEVKEHVMAVANNLGWDCLLPCEWQKLIILKDLLLPFAEHTQNLQSDTCSLSLIVPAILDLKCHLSDFFLTHAQSYGNVAALAQKMMADLDVRFSCFLDVSASTFSPLAAAASFFDVSLSFETLINNDEMQDLLTDVEEYIIRTVPHQEQATTDGQGVVCKAEVAEGPEQKRPRFRFFNAHRSPRPRSSNTINHELHKFREIISAYHVPDQSGIEFWSSQCSTTFPMLKPLALDLLAMPASQAFAERVFSLTGDLSHGRCNRARITLERSAFLKVNKDK